jgi:hypothetical protein
MQVTFSIEQAIFTQPQGDRSSASRLVNASPGISADDARELAAWGPGHDCLTASGPAAASFNFHPLPSGAFCLSRTVRATEPGEHRGSPCLYTHCLVATPGLLERFANHPFALYHAVTASPVPAVHQGACEQLETLRFEGRAAAVDQILLARLAVNPGPRWMGALVAAALDSVCLAVTNGPRPEELISGLLYCLPVSCRTEFSFATGLRFSPQRPFRIIGSSNAVDLRALAERYHLTVLDFSAPPPEPLASRQGWGRLVERVLATGQTPLLAAALSKQRFETAAADLPALALQLADEMERKVLRRQGDCGADEMPGESCAAPCGRQRAHAAHRLTAAANAAAPPAPVRPTPPSETLHPDAPEVLEKLEQLDDSVFDAIRGDSAAMEAFHTLWPQLRGQLGDELLQESREQYLRYALTIWEECAGADAIRHADRAIQALEVLSLLLSGQ